MTKTKYLIIIGFITLFLVSGFVVTQNSDTSHDVSGIVDEPQDTKDFNIPSAGGDNWLFGWQFREKLYIYETANAGTNYPFDIIIYHDTDDGADDTTGSCSSVCTEGNAQADFDDIRFTDNDGDTELDYWLEYKTDSDTARFWFEIADDCTSGQSVVIYIYYGNAGASSDSDGTGVFLFFDDFENNNLNRWDTVGADWSTGTNRAKYGTYCAYGDAGGTVADRSLFADITSTGTDDFMIHVWGQRELLTSNEYFFRSGNTDAGNVYERLKSYKVLDEKLLPKCMFEALVEAEQSAF